jgi:hypothetical protein
MIAGVYLLVFFYCFPHVATSLSILLAHIQIGWFVFLRAELIS